MYCAMLFPGVKKEGGIIANLSHNVSSAGQERKSRCAATPHYETGSSMLAQ
jgi:hypothetical protein